MKVLLIYGGVNKGLKKEIIEQGLHKKQSGSKLTNVQNLNENCQFFIGTVKKMLEDQKIAAVDEIDLVSRHFTDLEDYLYEPEPTTIEEGFVKDIKQLFQEPSTSGQYQDINSAKRFDFLDFVITDVPPDDLPWQEKS